MATRVISGIVLVVIALFTILSGGWILSGTLLLISLVAYEELCRAMKIHTEGKSCNAIEWVGFIGITAYYILISFFGSEQNGRVQTYIMLSLILTLMAFMFVYVLSFPRYKSEQVMAAFFSVVYAPVMLSCIYLTRSLEYGIYLVWMIFISSWICDTCAYFAGVTLGKHKLSPKLSPKKSIEGAIGGVAGSAAVGALFAYFVVERVVDSQRVTWIFALISGIGAVISQIGDLAASGIKRNQGIKDYGKLIPGHGGIMDRFDSVIFTAPIIYFLTALLIK